MDNTQARKLLGVGDTASAQEIQQAVIAKKKQANSLLSKAPTDALKAKYEKMLAQVDEAMNVLTTSDTTVRKPDDTVRAGFSQSKFEDLPFAKPRHSQFEDQAKAELSIQEGQVLAGRYKIEEKIAAGGMGVVYRAFDQNRSEDIAIKVMLPSLVKNARAKERFLDEARLSSKLSHANIVNVYDVQNDGDFYFLTMELLEGQDLRDVMENRKTTRQPFTKDEVLDLLDQITAGLNHAHQSTVHRDLKPENIYLTEEGEYKVMDFGIARVQSTSQRTQSGSVSGTAYYMAPEQVKGAKGIDARADQYAMAVFTYELLAGEVPTGMITPLHELRPDVGKGFSRALERALANKPEDRYDTLDDFLHALKKGKGGKARKRHSTGEGSHIGGKLAMAAMLLLGLGLIFGIWQSGLIDTDKLFMSKEEIAQRKAASAKLAGEIKIIQKRLENGRRSLDSDVRDAERNGDSNLAALEYWQRVTEDAIFESSILVDLEGQLAMADTLLRDESFDEAQALYNEAKGVYSEIYSNFQTAGELYTLKAKAEEAQSKWNKLKNNYGVGSRYKERDIIEIHKQADQYGREGSFVEAKNTWETANSEWVAIKESVSDKVAQVRAERKSAEKLRREKEEQKKMLERKEEEKRLAEADRVRQEKERETNIRIAYQVKEKFYNRIQSELELALGKVSIWSQSGDDTGEYPCYELEKVSSHNLKMCVTPKRNNISVIGSISFEYITWTNESTRFPANVSGRCNRSPYTNRVWMNDVAVSSGVPKYDPSGISVRLVETSGLKRKFDEKKGFSTDNETLNKVYGSIKEHVNVLPFYYYFSEAEKNAYEYNPDLFRQVIESYIYLCTSEIEKD